MKPIPELGTSKNSKKGIYYNHKSPNLEKNSQTFLDGYGSFLDNTYQ
jgi:hypothetical protein